MNDEVYICTKCFCTMYLLSSGDAVCTKCENFIIALNLIDADESLRLVEDVIGKE